MEVPVHLRLLARSLFAIVLGMFLSGAAAFVFILLKGGNTRISLGLGVLILACMGVGVWLLRQDETALQIKTAQILAPPRDLIFSSGLFVLVVLGLLLAGYWILEADLAESTALGSAIFFWGLLWLMVLVAMYPAVPRRVGKILQPLFMGIGVVVVVFAFGEGLMRLYDSFAPSEIPTVADVDERPETWTMITDTELDWAEQYWLDYGYASREVEWLPYVYWRMEPYDGVYVNIDERGIRHTLPPDSPATMSIHVYGGSTIWGVGARDDHTIPSEVVRAMAEQGVTAEVTNFGELGYIARQDATLFQLQLANGHVPDVAIFYWGFNDINSNLSSGRVGITASETQRAARFQGSQCTLDLSIPVVTNVLMYRTLLGERLLNWANIQPVNPAEGCLLGNQDWDAMNTVLVAEKSQEARDEAEYIAQMVKQVTAIAEAYDVQPMFIWQPSLFHKEPLSWYEQQIVEQGRWQEFGEQYRAVDNEVRQLLEDNERVLIWSDYFSAKFLPDLDPTLNIFIDKVHITEEGNALVAQGIVDYLIE